MGIFDFGRHTIGVGMAVVILVGCGGPQGTRPGALPMGNTTPRHQAHTRSGSSGDLVYVITANGIVILSYPAWDIVARIRAYRNWYSVCSDPNNGNVFAVTGNNEIDEYAHGGTTPIAMITLPSGYPTACSVDPTTGNLAVAAIDVPKVQDALFVYPQAQGNPTTYSDKQLPGIISPAYDDVGNLFFGARNKVGASRLGELKVGHSQFTIITLSGNRNTYLDQIQWDGRYLVFLVPIGRGYGTTVNQVQVKGRTGTVVNSFLLNHCLEAYFWIYNGSLLSFYYPPKPRREDYAIAAWSYPGGGKPTSRFYGLTKGGRDYLYDLTVSVAPSHK